MAAVNRNMFEATVTAHLPGDASLMVMPLNLIDKIISYVRDHIIRMLLLQLTPVEIRLTTPQTSPDCAGPAGSLTTCPSHFSIGISP